MRKKNSWLDIHFFLLISVNLYVIYYYSKNPNSYTATITIYWIQSILIGVFNFLDLLTLSKYTLAHANQEEEGIVKVRGCAAPFFLVHYLIFHLICFFIIPQKEIDFETVDWQFVFLCFWILLAIQTINFIQNKIRSRTEAVRVNIMASWPYIRIVPMLVMAITPVMTDTSEAIIFLVLKMIADLGTYIIYQKALFRPKNK